MEFFDMSDIEQVTTRDTVVLSLRLGLPFRPRPEWGSRCKGKLGWDAVKYVIMVSINYHSFDTRPVRVMSRDSIPNI
jgi:hypothetical protein